MRVGIGAQSLLIHVVLVYVFPLLGLFAGALGASMAVDQGGDAHAVGGAIIGLLLTHLVARFLRSGLRLDAGLRVQIIAQNR